VSDVTRILNAIERGEPNAAEQLLPLVYSELRRLAAVRLSHERSDHALDATGLVHEAYIRLVGENQETSFNSRGHFFGAAAESMRRILVEAARRKESLKRGGDRRRLALNSNCPATSPPVDLLALDEALSKLARDEPQKGRRREVTFFRWANHARDRNGAGDFLGHLTGCFFDMPLVG